MRDASQPFDGELPGRGGEGGGGLVTISGGEGDGGCKGISRQSVVPSSDASKRNTAEATFALMHQPTRPEPTRPDPPHTATPPTSAKNFRVQE